MFWMVKSSLFSFLSFLSFHPLLLSFSLYFFWVLPSWLASAFAVPFALAAAPATQEGSP
jgi:hypothetical protein